MTQTNRSTYFRARAAVLTAFFTSGAVAANWFVNIPLVKTRLSLSDARLGFILMSSALGALLGTLLAGWLITRFGSKPPLRVAATVLCAMLTPLIIAPNVATLVIALFISGMSRSILGVAMNASAVALEDASSKAIMSSFHGSYSLGCLLGAGLGAGLIGLGVSPLTHALAVTLFFGLGCLVVLRNLLPSSQTKRPAFALPTKALLGLGMLTFLVMLGEGAVGDWSAVYLSEVLGASASTAALGFASFSLATASARFLGDALKRRFGAVHLVRGSAILAAFGLCLGLASQQTLTAILGFGLLGLGLANLVPIMFGAAARVANVSAGAGIAAVASVGYLGFLAGPPLIGLAAELISLRGALLLVALLIAVVAAFAHSVKQN